MSSERVLDALISPSLGAGRGDGDLIDAYVRRLLELDRGPIYTYLHRRSEEVVRSLPNITKKACFVLGAWRVAPVEHWSDWAARMPANYKGGGLVEPTVGLLEHLLDVSPTLEPEATRSVIGHLERLKPTLKSLTGEAEAEALSTAVRGALERREWWTGEELVDAQLAVHELVRAIGAGLPRADGDKQGGGDPLSELRFRDIARAPLEGPAELKAMVQLAVGLSTDNYGELWDHLPEATPEEQPALFAERVVARVTLERRERGPDANQGLVNEYMKELRALSKLGTDYRGQVRLASIALIDLQPRPFQLDQLSRYLGASPGEEALAATGRWAERADRKDRSDALARMIRPYFDATGWVQALSQFEYTEAPVVRALSEALLERGTKVSQRVRMAAMTRSLRLRTQSGRDKLADLIATLLSAKQPKEDLRVALVLCEGLGPEHRRQTKLQRAFIAYSQRRSHKFTPAELPAIAASGVELQEKYLSKNARKQAEELVAKGLDTAARLGKLFGLG